MENKKVNCIYIYFFYNENDACNKIRKESNVNKILYAVPFHLMENIGLESNINYVF